MWNEIALYFVVMFSFYQCNRCQAKRAESENEVVQNEQSKSTKAIDVIDVVKWLLYNGQQDDGLGISLKRVKRQGAGKFAEAADMTEVKQLRLFATLIGNLMSKSATGGTHPLHPTVPKPVVLMFKQKILDFFYPPTTGSKQE